MRSDEGAMASRHTGRKTEAEGTEDGDGGGGEGGGVPHHLHSKSRVAVGISTAFALSASFPGLVPALTTARHLP